MPLEKIDIPQVELDIPRHVMMLIDQSSELINDYMDGPYAEKFVPADYIAVYDALVYLKGMRELKATRFCEWGSGFGVVALLARVCGFNACGIEIDSELVDHSRKLANHFNIDLPFYPGDIFKPTFEIHPELPDAFEIIFAYPWPGEREAIFNLFEQRARVGDCFLVYEGLEDLSLYRML